jgi:hypothetical protein
MGKYSQAFPRLMITIAVGRSQETVETTEAVEKSARDKKLNWESKVSPLGDLIQVTGRCAGGEPFDSPSVTA